MRRCARVLVAAMLCAVGCSDDGQSGQDDGGATKQDAIAACPTDLVGTWGATKIGSAPTVDASNSTWVFKSDGSYSWCLKLGPYNLDGTGTFKQNGASVTVDGEILKVVAASPMMLFDCGTDSFSFRDDENDAWTYQRNPANPGCAP